jgi:ABC-type lipoprotein export system ATPase subunit
MMEKSKAIMQLRNVVKAYATSASPFVALKDINLDIFPGEFLGITGKSGAGKTTLLNMISGVSDLTAGEVLFFNTSNGSPDSIIPIHKLNENQLGAFQMS